MSTAGQIEFVIGNYKVSNSTNMQAKLLEKAPLAK